MNIIKKIALTLTIVGALNWGLVGLFDFNLVTFIFNNTMLIKILYTIISVAGLFSISYFIEQ